jgi:DivIVA domain-containing protein
VLHLLISAVAAVVIAGVLFLLATRFLPAGEQIAPAVRDEPPWDLPAERRLTADDIDDLRLPVALRGYRFAETDLLLDRLADELRSRDEEIARLRGHRDGAPDAIEPGAADESVAAEPVTTDDDSR